MRIPEDNKQIEEAIKFLVFAIHKSSKNPKPVILHSIRVGFYLDSMNYDKEIIIAAILHDIIEDTDTKIEEVKLNFGSRVAQLVEANSFDENVQDETDRYKENFQRCGAVGKDALVVKAADFFDNVDYYSYASTDNLTKWLFEKLKYFIDSFEGRLKDEVIYQELVKKYQRSIKV